MTRYRSLWCIMSNMATFCINIFNKSSAKLLQIYEIVYGHKPPAITDLQLDGDELTHPAFYHFSDYLDLLNEHIQAIRDIVKENHTQTIQNRLQQHGLESPTLRSFNEGDIVYCQFPSKTIISDIKQQSKKLHMSFVGLLYIFSKHGKFMYLLSTIDGEVIEQTHLKMWLLRLPKANLSETLMITNWKLYDCITKMFFNQKHVHLTTHKHRSKLCYIFTAYLS